MIKLLLIDYTEEKIDILITLLDSVHNKINLNKEILGKLKLISEQKFSTVRINILLNDILEVYKNI